MILFRAGEIDGVVVNQFIISAIFQVKMARAS